MVPPVSYTHLDVYKRQTLGCIDCYCLFVFKGLYCETMSEAGQSSGRREGRGLVPEYFNKDELQFEIRLRGGVPQSDVASLRRQLRELLVGDVPLSLIHI